MKKMFRDVLCILLTAALTGTFLAAAAGGFFAELYEPPVFGFSRRGGGAESAASSPGSISGASRYGENTREELISLWNSIKTPYNGTAYDTVPSVAAPFSTGALRQGYLNDSLNYLNFYRKVAKMPALTLSQSKCEFLQYGAVLMAANGKASHSSNLLQPDGMTYDFFRKGKDSVDVSNIAYGKDYGENGIVMRDFIDACFEDTGQNLKFVAHRRWFLSPGLSGTGFGQATAENGDIFTAAHVVGYENPAVPDYDFISWPSSGWFPNEFISRNQSWNVCLNPDKFSITNPPALAVKITRESDGRVFNLTASDDGYSEDTAFLWYNPEDNYDFPLNITFHIGSVNHIGNTLTGDFNIEITGIRYKSTGAAAVLSYTVRFFSLDDITEPTTGDEKESSNTETSTTTQTTTTTTNTYPSTPARVLTSIAIAEKPAKLSYNYKDTLNTSGLTLNAFYSDGKNEKIKSGFTCSPTYFDKTGTQKVTVTYKGFSDSFNVSVKYTFYQILIRIFLLGFLWY